TTQFSSRSRRTLDKVSACLTSPQESLKHEHQPKYGRVILPTSFMLVDQTFQFLAIEVASVLRHRAPNGAAKFYPERPSQPFGRRHREPLVRPVENLVGQQRLERTFQNVLTGFAT